MATDKQLAANRANAQHSTGPRTPEGKAIARLNAVQHALTGQLTIVSPHQHDAIMALDRRLTASLGPVGEQELQVAARIVRDTWRLARAAANEENVYALGLMENSNDMVLTETGAPTADVLMRDAVTNARTYFEKIRDFDRASLYEQRLKRGLVQDYKLFHQLQKGRISLETHPGPAVTQSVTTSNGSVLSTGLTAPFGFDISRKNSTPKIVNSTHPWVSPYPPLPPAPVLDPYWPD